MTILFEETIKTKKFMSVLKRLMNMDVDQEEVNKLKLSLNSFLEDKGSVIDITINGKDVKIKRNKDMYFIKDFGWTNALGVYYEFTQNS
jgi:hypothetical protein